MKRYLILFISTFFIIFTNCIELQITSILTERVASDGMLILNTTGMHFDIKDFRPRFNLFNLTIKNEKSKVETVLKCTLFQFNVLRDPARVACLTKGLEEGRYSVNPIKKQIRYPDYISYNLYINPSNIEGTFLIQNGKEIYFYDMSGRPYINLYRDYDCDKIEFTLFDHISEIEDTKIYFDDIPINCYYSGIKLSCPIKAEQLTQTTYKSYNLYLKNGKKNYFVNSVHISLYYIKQ